jgi:hypothetical protein
MRRLNRVVPIILLFWLPGLLIAQEVAAVRAQSRNIEKILGISPAEPGKCGTSSIMLAFARWPDLSANVRQQVLAALQRPVLQKARPSPSGRFLIHYDTVGINAPALVAPGTGGRRISGTAERFIDSVGSYFDRVWKLEIDSLHYLAPPSDGMQGGGPEIDIYVQELGTDMFGQTSWSPSGDLVEDGPRQRFSTYIEIDNDFAGYRTPGMDGLAVTAAHEFFHAIQVGSYGVWSTVPNSDFYFYELSSVWMEHTAFGHVHDYYFYLPKYFQFYRDGQDRSFAFTKFDGSYRGYERAIWALYLTKRFGNDVLKQVWAEMRQSTVLPSTSAVLQRLGTTTEQEFSLFSIWNYYTADRGDPVRYYDESRNYPRFKPNVSMDFFGSQAVIGSAAPPLSTQLYQFVMSNDTITAVVSNQDVAGAQAATSGMGEVSLQMKSSGLEPPYQLIAPGIGISFKTADAAKWKSTYLRSSSKSNAVIAPGPSPNPFRLSRDSRLILPVTGEGAQFADVYILSSAAEKVFARQYEIRQSYGLTVVEVPAGDIRGDVATGVYFVVARRGEQEFKWKVAFIQ